MPVKEEGNMLRTRLCDLLGIDLPIILAGMGAGATSPSIPAALHWLPAAATAAARFGGAAHFGVTGSAAARGGGQRFDVAAATHTEVLLHPTAKRRSMARQPSMAGRRLAAERVSARPHPMASPRSMLGQQEFTAAPHFTAVAHMAAEHLISRWADRMVAARGEAARTAVNRRISRLAGLTAAVGLTAAAQAATTAEISPAAARLPGGDAT
jgi:enoyl reductase-like protein